MILKAGLAAAALTVATAAAFPEASPAAGQAAFPTGRVQLAQAMGNLAAPPYPTEMNLSQSDYVEQCGGCHGIQGDAAPADLPTLKGRVGWFMCTPEARQYLIRLPNVALSRISDNEQLADLLNFMVFGLGGDSVPKGAQPFTAEEVARERAFPMSSVSLIKTRATLVDTLIKRCGAPASLRLMYPGQAKKL